MNKATILRVDGSKEELDHQPTLEEAQKIVGGYIELLPLMRGSGTLVVNEEGRMMALPYNPQATDYYQFAIIVGDVILLEGWKSVK